MRYIILIFIAFTLACGDAGDMEVAQHELTQDSEWQVLCTWSESPDRWYLFKEDIPNKRYVLHESGACAAAERCTEGFQTALYARNVVKCQ